MERYGGAGKSDECRGTVSMLFCAPTRCRRRGSFTSGEDEQLDKGYSSEEPDAGKLQVRICGGGGGRPPPLPDRKAPSRILSHYAFRAAAWGLSVKDSTIDGRSTPRVQRGKYRHDRARSREPTRNTGCSNLSTPAPGINAQPAQRRRICVERAGMRDLNEGQKIAYEVVPDKRTGKSSAENLKPA